MRWRALFMMFVLAACAPPGPASAASARARGPDVVDTWHESPPVACSAFEEAWKTRPRERGTFPGATTRVLEAAQRDFDTTIALDDSLEHGCDVTPAVSFARRAALFDALYMRLYHTVRPPLFDDTTLRQLAELRASTKPPALSKADELAMEAERSWRFGKESLLDRIGQRLVQRYAEAVDAAHATRTGRVACRASLRRLAAYTYVLGDTKLGLFMVAPYRSGMFVRLRPQPVPASNDPRAAIAQNALDVGEPERAFPIYQLIVREHPDDQAAKLGLVEAERALGRTNDAFMQLSAGEDRALAERTIALETASRGDLDFLLAD